MTIKRILVPTDFTAASTAALTYAVDLAARFPAAVHVLHVIDMPRPRRDAPGTHHELRRAKRRLAAAARRLRRSIPRLAGEPLGVDHHVRMGDPVARIVECARDELADLIVMGAGATTSTARTAGRRLSEQVARRAPCAVLTLPTDRNRHGDKR